MRALETAQHNPTLVLGDYRMTSNQDERGSQAVAFLVYITIQKRGLQPRCLYTKRLLLYLSGTVVLHIKMDI